MSLIKTISVLSLAATASFGLIACGGDSGGGGNDPDPVEIDPTGTDTQFVVSELTVPANATQATAVAQDLDGDGLGDNALGGLLGSLAATAGLDLQTGVDEQLAAASFILLANIKATDLVNANGVGTYVFFGENPTPAACTNPDDLTTCGKQFSGDATFDIAANSPADAVIAGTLSGGALLAGPGSVSIELPLGDTAPLKLDLIAAHLDVSVSATNLMSGKLGGAITADDVDNKLMPSVQSLLVDLIAKSCAPEGTNCNCEAGSSGGAVLDFFDADGDCAVPLEELMSNSLIDATLRNPDLDLLDADGNFNPNSDGVEDSLSIGVGFAGVGASFTLPAGI